MPGDILDNLGLQQAALPAFDIERLNPSQQRIMGSVQGLLSVQERTVFVRDGLSQARQTWILLHEVAHAFIGWHREMLFLDTEFTLSRQARETMEREANEFAAHVLFLDETFHKLAQSMEFGVEAIFKLATIYSASVEATVRHYVEHSQQDCVCLVLDPCYEYGAPTLRVQYFVKPRVSQCRWEFGSLKIGQTLPLDDETVVSFSRGELNYPNVSRYESESNSPGVILKYECFSTSHKVFILCRSETL